MTTFEIFLGELESLRILISSTAAVTKDLIPEQSIIVLWSGTTGDETNIAECIRC